MASLIVRKLDASVVELNDLGLSITGPALTTFDLISEQPNDISVSNDLLAAISGSSLIAGQTEANFPGTGAPDGDFVGGDGVGGTAYVVSDIITLSNGATIVVDAVDANGDVTAFTIESIGEPSAAGVTLTQVDSSGAGLAFTLTPEANNQGAATLEVLDPRDDTTVLSAADGQLVVRNHNLPHFGIQGGRFDNLDDPNTTPTNAFLLDYNSTSGQYEQIDPAVVVSNNQDAVAHIVSGMIVDGTDTTVAYNPTATPIIEGQVETNYDGVSPNGTFVGGDGAGGTAYAPGDTITLSDGSVITVDAVDGNGDVTDFTVTTNGGNVTAGVALTQNSTSGTGTGFTLTPENPNISQGEIQVNVDDSFLRNTGDTLDSGTLTIASGATLEVAAGGSLTIADAPTNPTDATNKAYVDSLSAGLDPKESVRYATVSDPGGTYSPTGGTAGTGAYTSIDLTAAGPFDGLTAGAIQVGDRILIKDADPATENGIYVVTTAGATGAMERAPDQDGAPTNEVSGGNFTFVENGTTLAGTGWVVVWDGDIVLNTDPVNWTQFSESTAITAGIGLSLSGQTIDLDVDDLVAATIVGTDTLAFHDADGTAEASGSQTRKTTVTNFLADLDIVNGITTNGILVRTADDTYTSVAIAVNGAGALDGLAVTNGDGVAGNPTIGLDINSLPVRSDAVDVTDRVAVYNITSGANEYYTVGELAGAVASTNSFSTWAGAGNTTGDASIVADSSSDTATLSGGDGININFTASTDTLVFSLTRAGLADTAIEGTDTVPFFDGSNANAPEYRSFNDIVADLNLPSVSTINGQPVVTYTDTTRSKTLAVSDTPFMFSDEKVNHLEWLNIGRAIDADSGYIMPLDGTIVYATGHCEDTGSNTKDIHLFIDGVDQGSIGTLTGGTDVEFFNTTLDLDFTQNQKIRLQAQDAATGDIKDVVVTVFVRWRAA